MQDSSKPSHRGQVFLITLKGSREGDKGILAVWRNGRIVWSEDEVNGGPPYWIGKTDPKNIVGVLNEIKQMGFTATAPLQEFYFNPNAKWINIVVYDGSDKIVDIGSWHEIHETKAGLVVTAAGVESLRNRTKSAVLKKQPSPYRLFRQRWNCLKTKLLGLISESRQKFNPRKNQRIPW